MDWGDVPSWLFGLVGIAIAIYYRRKLHTEEARNKMPRLVMTHELRSLPTMKGYRERAGVRVHLINAGGRALFIRGLYWGRNGDLLRSARDHTVDESPRGEGEPLRLAPDEQITIETEKLDGGVFINELHVIDISGAPFIHEFEELPAKGYIAAMPGEAPPSWIGGITTEPDPFSESGAVL
jgi:hypothetical protein